MAELYEKIELFVHGIEGEEDEEGKLLLLSNSEYGSFVMRNSDIKK